MNLLLVGSPNTGKTTLFNTLTKSDEHTGNWHGVTVEEKRKQMTYGGETHFLSDLPGTYSLSPFSIEEEVTLDKILSNKKSSIINICQSIDLERNLILTLELLEFGLKPIVFINKISNDNLEISEKKLASLLDTEVVVCPATSVQSKKALFEAVSNKKISEKHSLPDYLKGLNIEKIEEIISKQAKLVSLPQKFCAIKILEKDEKIIEKLKLNDETKQIIEDILPSNSISLVAKRRNAEAKRLYLTVTKEPQNKSLVAKKIDKVLVSKLWSFPIFFLVFALVFLLSFFLLGTQISFFLQLIFTKIADLIISFFSSSGPWLKDFLENGVFAGTSSLIGFCGQVTLLYIFLAIIEDTGYFSRIAFIWEDFLQKIGLNGRSVYSILLGFGCSTSAMLTARNASNIKSKIKTVLLIPFMSCSAKLPIFLLVCAAFFNGSILIIAALLFASLIIGVFSCYILSKTILKSTESEFVFELAPLKMPSVKRVLKLALINIKNFFLRIFGVVLFASIVLWFIQKHSFSLGYLPQGFEGSILQSISSFFVPIFIPLGLGTIAIVATIFSGIVAKEVVVSSIALFNFASISAGMTLAESITNAQSAVSFSPVSVLSFLVFCLLYTPCIAAIAMCSKECGKKWAIFMVVFQTTIAYLGALLTKIVLEVDLVYLYIPALIIGVLIFCSIFFNKKCNGCSKNCSSFKCQM